MIVGILVLRLGGEAVYFSHTSPSGFLQKSPVRDTGYRYGRDKRLKDIWGDGDGVDAIQIDTNSTQLAFRLGLIQS